MKSPTTPVRDDRLEPSIPTSGDSEKRFGLWLFVGPFLLVGVIVSVLLAIAPLTRLMQVKSTMKSLSKAIISYESMYHKLPRAERMPKADKEIDSADVEGNIFLETLTGPKRNLRGIEFWSPPAKGRNGYMPGLGLKDAWGKSYRIILDYDGDRLINDPEGIAGKITAEVLIYSAGPDGDYSTWKDNACSWK